MSIIAQKITYIHPDNEVLFKQINLIINRGEKVALIGNNGSGKSTFLRILSGELQPQEGEVKTPSSLYYIPQHFGQYDSLSVAEALHIDKKRNAMQAILNGDTSIQNFNLLDDDWNIEERCFSALSFWGLENIQLDQPMQSLSGGEKTKVFLSGIEIHLPSVILMDEPTNHLDTQSREKLYNLVRSSRATLLLVSHDRTLLNMLSSLYELTKSEIVAYGGNYDFYKQQRDQEQKALATQLKEKEKELRQIRKENKEMEERKEKHETRGKKTKIKNGVPRIAMGALKDQAEKSRSKLNDMHQEKIVGVSSDISQIRSSIPDIQAMKINFNASELHIGKILITGQHLNFHYDQQQSLWRTSLDFQIKSGERWIIKGGNGSGKTTLIKLMTGLLSPTEGKLTLASFTYIYVDQEYSLIQNQLTVYEQAQSFNKRNFKEHEIKMLLNRYLFPYGTWNKRCEKLSGGEKMRLMFCCLMISNQTPDLFILDEPTNNLDIQNIEIITAMIKEFKGTILIVSHDTHFTHEIEAEHTIELV